MNELDTKRTRNKVKWLLGSLFVLALSAASVHWFNENLNAQHMANSCQERVEASVDPVMLQSWALNLLKDGSNTPLNRRLPSLDSAWPREKPQVGVRLQGATNYVLVSWGAETLRDDCRWGLAIGSPTFVIPQYSGWKSRAWKPGIFFWQYLHRQLQARNPGDIE